ncbi:ABC transporter ATP-binding protein [Solibacillus cecembensis]|uniref:ABC transporter ATP-binding protein n=1 Tax=Solibacillus cecembensis TaxID=459347 RepID=UPI003D019F93
MKISIHNVSRKYGQHVAIKELNLELTNGVFGLLGPNGAGKSTLMKMLATIERPSAGKIYVNELDITKSPKQIRKQLGYLPQDFGIYPNMTPIEFLEYMAVMKGLTAKSAKIRILELLELLNLEQHRNRMIGSFSGGMKQRVGIAQSLLNDPMLLIVDEPTVGLDPQERINFRNLLASLSTNRIIILSTHIVSDIESLATNIAILVKGDLQVQATPEALIQQVENKVWQSVIPSSTLAEVQKKFIVSSMAHRSDGLHVRIVNEHKPLQDAIIVESSLEDAYLYHVVKKVERI